MNTHYAFALFWYEFAIHYGEHATFVSLDDKHTIKVGEPDYAIGAVGKGKKVISRRCLLLIMVSTHHQCLFIDWYSRNHPWFILSRGCVHWAKGECFLKVAEKVTLPLLVVRSPKNLAHRRLGSHPSQIGTLPIVDWNLAQSWLPITGNFWIWARFLQKSIYSHVIDYVLTHRARSKSCTISWILVLVIWSNH